MTFKLYAASIELKLAEADFVAALRNECPVGVEVLWDRNGFHRGTVVLHGYGTRVQVTNSLTGKTLWIYGADICRAFEKCQALGKEKADA